MLTHSSGPREPGSPANAPPDGDGPGLITQLGVAVVARTALNTARRFPYTYAAVLAAGLEVPLTAVTSLIAVSQATSVLAPMFGPLGDRHGYRVMLLAGIALLTGMGLVAVFPLYGVVLGAVVLASLGKNIFDPALQAYVGQRVSLEKRGLAIGAVELAWAGSTLVGIPLVGLLIDGFGWQSPFLALGLAGAVGWVALARVVPTAAPRSPGTHRPLTLRRAWGTLARSPAAGWALAVGFLISAANDVLFVIYGAWLTQSFSLGVVALGTATMVIGAAEMCGEGLTAGLADTLGLGRALTLGVLATAAAYLLLPVAETSLPLALAGLFLVFLAFEFTMVTSFSLFTEVAPAARATMMSTYFAASGLGRVAGAFLGGVLWANGGLAAAVAVCAAVNLVAWACLRQFGRAHGGAQTG